MFGSPTCFFVDEARWGDILTNIKSVAAGAHGSGSFFTGVILDPETYRNENPWSYPVMVNVSARNGHGQIEWTAYRAKVQERTKSSMQALLKG